MWILMLDTYIGGIGTFLKGHKVDIAPDILAHLPKDSYKKTRPPWDAQKDVKAIKRAELTAKAHDAQVWADVLQDRADKAKQRADQLVAGVAKLQAENVKAEQAAKETIAKANKADEQAKKHPSENNLAKATELKAAAYRLARESERKSLESQKAHAELTATMAEQGLKRLDADDAKREAEKLMKIAEAKAQKQTEAKAKAETEAKAKAEAEAKAKAETEAKVKAEAEEKARVSAEAEAKAEAELGAKADAGLKDVTGKLGIAGQAEVKDESENEKPAAEQIDEPDVK